MIALIVYYSYDVKTAWNKTFHQMNLEAMQLCFPRVFLGTPWPQPCSALTWVAVQRKSLLPIFFHLQTVPVPAESLQRGAKLFFFFLRNMAQRSMYKSSKWKTCKSAELFVKISQPGTVLAPKSCPLKSSSGHWVEAWEPWISGKRSFCEAKVVVSPGRGGLCQGPR